MLSIAAVVSACSGSSDAGEGGVVTHYDSFVFARRDTSGTPPGGDIKLDDAGAVDPFSDTAGDASATDVETDAASAGDISDASEPVDTSPIDISQGGDVVCGTDGVGCTCARDEDCLAWDDGDLCNGVLVCRAQRCAADPRTVVDCPAGDGVCGTSSCDPSTGDCVVEAIAADGTPCDDGEPCTEGDACRAGVCEAGGEWTCGPAGDCEPAQAVSCGGAYGVTTASAMATSVINSYSCATGTFPGPEMTYTFSTSGAKQIHVFFTGGGAAQLFLLPGGDTCEPNACVRTTTGDLTWIEPSAASYLIVVDGTATGSSGFQIDCYDQGQESCTNYIDDDWDGLTDCDDSEDCAEDPACIPHVCPDGICHPTREDCESCPEDCGPCSVCPDGECTDGYEDCESCPDDCGPCSVCPDGECTAGYETCESCPDDCGVCPFCGDGSCNADETCATCAADCGVCPFCGDGSCNADETCVTCAADCGDCPLPCVDEVITCGANIIDARMGNDNDVSGYSCSGGVSGSGDDRAYRLDMTTSARVSVSLDIGSYDCYSDYDLFILEDSCDGATCIDSARQSGCDESLSFDAQAGHSYVIVVETFGGGTSDEFDLRVDCR